MKRRWIPSAPISISSGFSFARLSFLFSGSSPHNCCGDFPRARTKTEIRCSRFGCAGSSFISLPLFALCLTFGAFDWMMSLNYRWYSTMFGVYIFAGTAGSSMALLVMVITALRQAGYLKGIVTLEHYHIMGKWMLAFCVFWAYIGFGQYMLIWYANIPEETQFFLTRNTQSWWALTMLLVIGRFFAPFAILLLRSIKKNPHQLSILAGWMIFMQMLDMYLIVLPALHGTGVHVSIWDLICLIAMGATLSFVYLRVVPRTSLFPVRDPRLIESLTTVN